MKEKLVNFSEIVKIVESDEKLFRRKMKEKRENLRNFKRKRRKTERRISERKKLKKFSVARIMSRRKKPEEGW